MRDPFLVFMSLVTLPAAGSVWADSTPYVAGLTPWERPIGAPAITEVHHGADWYQRALVGVESPYPASLRFLEDQGAWFTPFNHPGMTGPYDLRGWYPK